MIKIYENVTIKSKEITGVVVDIVERTDGTKRITVEADDANCTLYDCDESELILR